MAVSKLWQVDTRLDKVIDYAANHEKTAREKYTAEQYQALADVIKYAKDEEKTEQEFFVEGINCNPATAREQFITVKKQFDKTDGIQAYHGYLSFKEMNISPDLAQKIGMEFANKVWGKRFQVVVSTHLNTKHLHCHFVVNSVSFADGKRCRETSWFKFRHIADELCQKYGLYYNPTPNRSKQNSYYYKREKMGLPSRYNYAKAAIDEAISYSTSVAELKYYLEQMGYKYQLSPQRKYWTVVPKGWNKPIRLINLGEGYSNTGIIKRLQENQNKVILKPFQKRQSNRLSGKYKSNKKKNLSNLYRLYLYYCYKLSYFPKSQRYNKQNPNKVHYLLRDDLMKLDIITAQTRLLGRYDIKTSEQLFSYKAKIEGKMQDLAADRTHLRNKIRRVNITDEELSKAKDEISAISSELKELRREVKLCNGIAERSGIIKEKLETVIAEEEQLNGKVVREDERRR